MTELPAQQARQLAATLSLKAVDLGFLSRIDGVLITELATILSPLVSRLAELERSVEGGSRCPHGCYITPLSKSGWTAHNDT